MRLIQHIPELRAVLAEWRAAGQRISLVPTMGNLHAGHLSLVDLARENSDRCVASVFVNPTQFGPDEDYDSYPRTLDKDLEKLGAAGVDMVFAPAVEEVYPWLKRSFSADSGKTQSEKSGYEAARVVVPQVSQGLCGASRPGHFDGVATVVSILFHLVWPDVAVFGKKDYQQLAVIRRFVHDLHMPIEILGGETGRETDGLAMSSRNQYLTEDERQTAPQLYQTLCGVREKLAAGSRSAADRQALLKNAGEQLSSAGFRPDYLEVRRPDLALPGNPEYGSLVVLAAAWLGKARLLDNIEVPPFNTGD